MTLNVAPLIHEYNPMFTRAGYGSVMRLAFFPILLCCAPVPAAAQSCQACDAPEAAEPAQRERPVQITIVANLDFSRLTVRDGGGTLAIDPVTGATVPRGSVAAIGGMAFSGRAIVEGEPNRAVRVLMPGEITLSAVNGSGTVRVRNIVSTLSPSPQLGPDGRLEFAFGGELTVDGGASGEFRGRIAITVGYE
jgi:hypothetical protein